MYKSSEVEDGIKFRIPTEIVRWIIFALIMIAIAINLLLDKDTQKYAKAFTNQQGESTEQSLNPIQNIQTANLSTIGQSIQQPTQGDLNEQETQRIAMVFETPDGCIAKNHYGQPINISEQDCKDYANGKQRLSSSQMDYTQKHSHQITTTVGENYGKNL